jgi:hypothetical protein
MGERPKKQNPARKIIRLRISDEFWLESNLSAHDHVNSDAINPHMLLNAEVAECSNFFL